MPKQLPLVPEAYQLQAAEFIVSREASALWAEMGIGKTISALLAVQTLRGVGKVRRVLVLAPLLVATTVWPAELSKWPEFADLDYRLLRDKDMYLEDPPTVMIINYEMLSWFTGWDFLQAMIPCVDPALTKDALVAAQIKREARVKREFRKGLKRLIASLEIDMLVLDECTRIKSTSSKVHEFVREIAEHIKYKVGLTGTPAADHIDDVFGQLLVLDGGASLGAYVTHFRGRYFTKVNPRDVYSPLVLQPGALERIHEDIKDTVLRIGAKGNVKLPDLVYRARRFKLDSSTQAAYDEMESTMITTGKDGELHVAAAAVGAQSKCMQLAGGALYRNPVDPVTGMPVVHEDKYTTFGTAKLEQLDQMLEELAGEQVLVVYWFRHERERILKRVKNVGTLNGTKADVDVINDWNRGRLRRLMIHPASAGHGLNLPGRDAHHVVMFSTPWQNELLLQVCARLRRRGNEAETIFVHQLIAKDTIDEIVAYDKTAKSRRQEKLFKLLSPKETQACDTNT